MTLNLKSADGLRVLRRMVERADVIVENYRPDVKTRLGIDYETLSAVNPRLDLREHLRLRAGRPLSATGPASIRSRRACRD